MLATGPSLRRSTRARPPLGGAPKTKLVVAEPDATLRAGCARLLVHGVQFLLRLGQQQTVSVGGRLHPTSHVSPAPGCLPIRVGHTGRDVDASPMPLLQEKAPGRVNPNIL